MKKPKVSHYEVYRGKNGDHYIEVLKSGKKRYYITKDAPIGSDHTANMGTNKSTETSLGSPDNIIPSSVPNYNSQVGNSQKLYGGVEMNVEKAKTSGQLVSIDESQSKLFGYKNPLTGSNHIFTREEIASMSLEEFVKHEKEIDAQTKAFNGTMPTNRDLQQEAQNGGGVIYVDSYTRSDGTEVRGYYRSR